ncbi:MAG TPA: hypothetical protein VH092_10260 [Urbifossiella sp.]|jgi:hypothetical protein|nr:hypothetical protein [Urbifossiella sp.]
MIRLGRSRVGTHHLQGTEFPFLELQFGIGRVDWAEVGTAAFAGYETPAQLRLRFGPEAV